LCIFLVVERNEGITFSGVVGVSNCSSTGLELSLEFLVASALIDSIDKELTALLRIRRHLDSGGGGDSRLSLSLKHNYELPASAGPQKGRGSADV